LLTALSKSEDGGHTLRDEAAMRPKVAALQRSMGASELIGAEPEEIDGGGLHAPQAAGGAWPPHAAAAAPTAVAPPRAISAPGPTTSAPSGAAPPTGRRPIGVGLTNLGQTCFMNASLQLLVHLPGFYDWAVEHRTACR
jgi:hypothetical protein